MKTTIPITLLLCLAAPLAHADDSLRCDLARADQGESFSAGYAGGQADAKNAGPDALGLGFESSLGAQTYLLVLQDFSRQRRVAFLGSNLSVSPDGGRLATRDASADCSDVPASGPAFPIPPKAISADYFVCMLDEAEYRSGTPADSKRSLVKSISPLSAGLPVELSAEDDATSIRVHYLSYDPFQGLVATLTDKASGETATYTGPARSMGVSFMLGLTLGDRDKEAKFLRLGCVWTDTPANFK